MIVSANQKSNQQMTEVDGWEDGDDGNEQGWPIAREKGKDGNNDQTTSANANANTATSKEQSTKKAAVVMVREERCCRKGEDTTTITILYDNWVEVRWCGGGDGDEAPLTEEDAVTMVKEGCAVGRGGTRRRLIPWWLGWL